MSRGTEVGGQRLFGKYVLERHLWTEGDFIETFETTQTLTGSKVEIRILKVTKEQQPALCERFVHEVRLLARIDHPSIIRVLDVGEELGRLYFTTPHRSAVRLKDWLAAQGGTVPLADVVRFGELLTDALALIHAEGLLHRGITSSTVYVDVDARLPYFGECSVMKDLRSRYGPSDQGIPSLALLASAPEDLTGDPWDHRADVYQLCALMFELLTGKEPTPEGLPDKHAAMYRKYGSGAPGPLLACHADAGTFAKVLLKGLAFERGRRHAGARELGDELAEEARRLDLKLFVRAEVTRATEAAASAQARQAPPRKKPPEGASRPVASVDPVKQQGRSYFWLGLAAGLAFGMTTLFIGLSQRPAQNEAGSRRPPASGTRPIAAPTAQASSAQADALFLKLLEETAAEADPARRFKARWDGLTAWLKSRPAAPPGAPTYVDLLKVRARFDGGDVEAVPQLERWVEEAREGLLRPATTPGG